MGIDPGTADADTCEENWRLFADGTHNWTTQTYMRLNGRLPDITLSSHFHPDAVNIVHNKDIRQLPDHKGVVVGLRADYPRCLGCALEVVQNKAQIGRKAIWMPHWPQPGLIRRTGGLPDKLLRVGYFGLPVNHYSKITGRASGFSRVEEKVKRTIEKLGDTLVVKGPKNWNDFSDVDVILGIRSFGRSKFNTKPATKLVNSWLGGVPFIGGRDSAFRQIGVPDNDYLVATSPRSLAGQLVRLQENPAFWHKLMENGRRAAKEYNCDHLSNKWVNFLKGSFQRFE